MDKYTKILIAKKNKKNQCYCNDGDILYFASNSDRFKGKLSKNRHFFVSLNDRLPSLYGWVIESEQEYTALDLARKDYISKNNKEPDSDGFISETELKEYNNFLKKLNKMKPDSVMAIDWKEKLNIDTYKKEKSLWFHLVKFYKA